jgi:hypothetical protein
MRGREALSLEFWQYVLLILTTILQWSGMHAGRAREMYELFAYLWAQLT